MRAAALATAGSPEGDGWRGQRTLRYCLSDGAFAPFSDIRGIELEPRFDRKRPPVYRLPITVRTQQAEFWPGFLLLHHSHAHHAHWTEQQLIRRLFLLVFGFAKPALRVFKARMTFDGQTLLIPLFHAPADSTVPCPHAAPRHRGNLHREAASPQLPSACPSGRPGRPACP
jgi:hypothetical protein